jgi:hypothetical protein
LSIFSFRHFVLVLSLSFETLPTAVHGMEASFDSSFTTASKGTDLLLLPQTPSIASDTSEPPKPFYVHATILSVASSVLGSMIEEAPLVDEATKQLTLSESPETIRAILLSIYPTTEVVDASSLEELAAILEAVIKYQLLRSLKMFKQMMFLPHIISEPLSVFILAVRLGFEPEARRAATYCISTSPYKLKSSYMDEIPASVYHKLFKLREDVMTRSSHVVRSASWTRRPEGCQCEEHARTSLYASRVDMDLMADPMRNDIFDIKRALEISLPSSQCWICIQTLVNIILPTMEIELRAVRGQHIDAVSFATPASSPSPESSSMDVDGNDVNAQIFTEHKYEFGDAPVDVILKPQDASLTGTIFAHRMVLSASSPFFRAMFSLPQAAVETSEIPVIDMDETKRCLEALLNFMYPTLDREIQDLSTLDSVFAAVAAGKYDLHFILQQLRRQLVSETFLKKDPLHVYAIACKYGFRDEASTAAKHTLNIQLQNMSMTKCPPLPAPLHDPAFRASHYRALLCMHAQRAEASDRIITRNTPPNPCICRNPDTPFDRRPSWWYNFLFDARIELHSRPSTAIVFEPEFLQKVFQRIAGRCEACSSNILRSQGFLMDLKRQIDELPTDVSFD